MSTIYWIEYKKPTNLKEKTQIENGMLNKVVVDKVHTYHTYCIMFGTANECKTVTEIKN